MYVYKFFLNVFEQNVKVNYEMKWKKWENE